MRHFLTKNNAFWAVHIAPTLDLPFLFFLNGGNCCHARIMSCNALHGKLCSAALERSNSSGPAHPLRPQESRRKYGITATFKPGLVGCIPSSLLLGKPLAVLFDFPLLGSYGKANFSCLFLHAPLLSIDLAGPSLCNLDGFMSLHRHMHGPCHVSHYSHAWHLHTRLGSILLR